MSRLSRDGMLMAMAHIIAGRSTCDRANVGCVLSLDGRVLSAGYNGSTPLAPHCDDVGHMMKDGHCIRTVHAEANAISNAALNGIKVDGSTAYCTHRPCEVCIKQLLCAGVARIVYASHYDTDGGVGEFYRSILSAVGAELIHMPMDPMEVDRIRLMFS